MLEERKKRREREGREKEKRKRRKREREEKECSFPSSSKCNLVLMPWFIDASKVIKVDHSKENS